MFESQLSLIKELNGQLALLATTLVPNCCYRAERTIAGAPSSAKIGKHVCPIQLHLEYRRSKHPGDPTRVSHRVINVDLADGDVLTVFVLLDNVILNSTETLVGITPIDGKLIATDFLKSEFGLPPPVLTPALCQGIVIRAAPMPWTFISPMQQLSCLGVVDASRSNAHKAAIYQQMKSIGYRVFGNAIASGPDITVSASRDSVFDNVL